MCVDHTTGSVGVRDLCERYVTTFFRWGAVSTSPNHQVGGPSHVGCPRLLIQCIRSYPPYWKPFLHPQPEDPLCRGDRDLSWSLLPLSVKISVTQSLAAHSTVWFSIYVVRKCHYYSVMTATNSVSETLAFCSESIQLTARENSSHYKFKICKSVHRRSQGPRGPRRGSAAARLLRSWAWIPQGAWMFVCCECCVLSGRGLCFELITCPEKSYRLWCVVMCDLEISRKRRSWPNGGCRAKNRKSPFIILQFK
jgi:hypothetical protein